MNHKLTWLAWALWGGSMLMSTTVVSPSVWEATWGVGAMLFLWQTFVWIYGSLRK